MTRRRLALATLVAAPVLLAVGPAAAALQAGAAAPHVTAAAHSRTTLRPRSGNCVGAPVLGCVSVAYALERSPIQSVERPGEAGRPGGVVTLAAPRSTGPPALERTPSRVTPLATRQAERGPPGFS
jgi:hypothetical protein